MASDAAISIALSFIDQATSPMQSSLSKISDSAKKMESQFLGLTSVIKGFIGTLTIGSALKLGMEYETAVTRMKSVFQEGSGSAIESLEKLSAASHHVFDFTDLAHAALKIEDTFEIMHMSSRDLEITLSRVMDISRAKGLDLEEAITKLNSAFMGAAKSGRQLGLNLNDTYMEHEAFGGKLKDIWQTISDGDKYFFRYSEFLIQSQKYAGAASKETTTLALSLKSLANTIKDDLEQTFAGATGWLTQLVNWMIKAREVNVAAQQETSDWKWGVLRENWAAQNPGGIRKAMPSAPESASTVEKVLGTVASTELPQGWEQHVTPIKGKGGGSAKAATDPLKDYNRIMEEGTKITEQNFDATEKYNAEMDKLTYYVNFGAISQDTYGRAVEKTWEALVKANSETEGWREFYDLQKDASKLWDETRTEAEKYGLEIERLNYLLGYGVINQDLYNRGIDAAKDKFEKTTDKMSEFAVQAARNIESSLGDTLYNTITGKFDNIGTEWLNLLAKMASEAAAAQIGAGLFGDFGTTKKIGGVVGALGSWLVSLMGFAGGGDVYGGRPIIVGERGPEIFTPRSSGRITPNGQIGMGAPNVIVNIKNETGQQVQAEQGLVSFDGNAYHANIHLRLLKNNVGGFRDATRSLLSGGR
jgi:hypothetical protein